MLCATETPIDRGCDMTDTPSADLQPGIPAATLVLFREGPGGPEVLMLERAAAMAFAGGAMVFPGGRIDPGDEALAAIVAPDVPDAAARICAVRETLEEAGISIGIDPTPAAASLAEMRAALHAGATLGEVLAGGATLALGRLVPFARWLPQHANMRIFDAHFYLAECPAGSCEAVVDRTENVRLAWMRPADTLAAADAGELSIIYPTRRNLERLALFGSYADAVAHAHAYPVRTITPFTEERDGLPHLCIPDDCGYPVTSEPMTGVRRA
jgi:8-oxo-dGTP pyrophosphatase MutT (NUDIX family)